MDCNDAKGFKAVKRHADREVTKKRRIGAKGKIRKRAGRQEDRRSEGVEEESL
jgi:hypothetical protein